MGFRPPAGATLPPSRSRRIRKATSRELDGNRGMLRKEAVRGIMGRQQIHIHSHTTIGPGQIHAGQEIRMNLSQKTDHLIPAEDAAGFSRMKDFLMDTGPE